jgi:hypothetical protein
VFAYGATTATVTIGLDDYGDFAAVTAGTPTGWDVWGNHKGSVGTDTLFTVTPEATGGWTGDMSVILTLANAEDLVEVYRILVLEITIKDSTTATIGGPEYLTLARGEVDMDINYDADTPYTVEITGGYYISHKGGWTTGQEDPLIMCQVLQRSAP